MRQPIETHRPMMPAALMPFGARRDDAPPTGEAGKPREETQPEKAVVRFWRHHFGRKYPRE